ncbi:MAG: fibronectin type III domain-containing protein, partial [Lachnospiraceae bacterium]|nr:fibronectin type III domain-containing protein [Lachnospiraceae bacterium]
MKRRLVNLLLSTCIVLTTVSQGSGAVLAANAVNIQATVEEPVVTTGKTIYVDHSMETMGSGSSTSPYKDFTTALTRAADGDTIIIKSKGAYVGVEEGTELLPLVINKAVTIIGEDRNSFINIRSAGILLEADVTIRNLNLSLSNKCHAAICANGYRLELDNVTYENGSRKVHVFAGKMTKYQGDSYSKKTGTSGQVIIKGAKTKLGNIYAGSMNSSFDLPVTITIEGATNMQLGAVYACGALEGVYDEDNFLDYESEPTDPTANASTFPMTGQVSLQVSGTNLSAIDGKMNESGGQADLTFSTTVLENRLDLSNIRSLTVTSGELQPSVLNEGVNLSVNQDAVLDLSTVMTANNNGFTVKDFTGGGTLKVGIADVLTVTGNITGSTAFETTGSNADGSSGIVYEDYGYIDVSSAQGDGIFTFQPHPTQSALVWEKVDGVWRSINPNQEETGPMLTGFQFEQEEHTAAIEEIDSEGGIAIGTTCSFKEDGSWPDLGNIPFSYEVQCFGYTYTQKSQGEDGWYQASIPALNLRFEPNGDDVNGANLWVYAIDDAAQIYPGEYLIKLKVPEANGGQESTIKLTIVGDDPGTVPEAPEASDKTAPVITALTASEVTENTAVVTATASDDTEVTSYQLTQTAGEGQASIQETETKGVFQISNLTSSTAYTFTVTVKDKAGNTSTKEVSFTTQEAEKIDLSAATVTVNGTYTYTGNALTPEASDVVVTLNGSPVDASQYTITVTNNVNAGTATVTVEGKDGYSGSAEGTF